MCGLLRYSLYGTRDAAQNWEEELASTLEPHRALDDPGRLTFSHCAVCLAQSDSLLDEFVQSLSPVLQLSARCHT